IGQLRMRILIRPSRSRRNVDVQSYEDWPLKIEKAHDLVAQRLHIRILTNHRISRCPSDAGEIRARATGDGHPPSALVEHAVLKDEVVEIRRSGLGDRQQR